MGGQGGVGDDQIRVRGCLMKRLTAAAPLLPCQGAPTHSALSGASRPLHPHRFGVRQPGEQRRLRRHRRPHRVSPQGLAASGDQQAVRRVDAGHHGQRDVGLVERPLVGLR